MATELFDEVDSDDNVIGVTHKAEAHANGLIHRVAAVYVFDKDGNLYVQDHIKASMLDHSVGGHVSKDEAYDDAAMREAMEEINIEAPLEHIGTFYSDETYTGSNYRHMFALYTCVAPDDWSFRPNEEVKNIYPMSLETIVQQMNEHPEQFTPGFLNTMEYYLHHTGSTLKLELDEFKGRTKS